MKRLAAVVAMVGLSTACPRSCTESPTDEPDSGTPSTTGDGGATSCAPDPCHGHGACSVSGNTAACACQAPYTGTYCDACATGFQDADADGTCTADCAHAGLTCGTHGACDHTTGTAACACELGWTGAGCAACAAGFHDENGTCVADATCQPNTCSTHGQCADNGGTTVCTCDAGYTGANCGQCAATHQDNDSNGSCEPTCATAAPACGAHGACDDSGGTAACACGTGYTGSACGQCAATHQDNDGDGACEPTCATAAPNCPGHGTCTDAAGVAQCECDPGWRAPTCDTCAAGFHADTGACLADTSCLAGTCNAHGTCDATTGAPVCTCDAGYSGGHCDLCQATHQDHDGNGTCEPTCVTAAPNCGAHGACSDATGAALCVCQPGYRGATCRQCATGFQDHDGDGTCAADCGSAALACGAHGACDDTGGTASCRCDAGWTGAACAACAAGFHDDAGACVPDTTCGATTCGGHGTCADASGTPVCTCDTGYIGAHCDACATTHQDYNGDGSCDPTCATAALDCGLSGACTDATGTAACACSTGHTGPACETCATGYQDHDGDLACLPDCALAALACGHGACADVTGVATCLCDAGWRAPSCTTCAAGYHADGATCVADTTCAADTCNGHGTCDDTSGVPVCSCAAEYQGANCQQCNTGYQDRDFNGTCTADCALAALSCGAHGACVDASGTALCGCNTGYAGAACDACAPGYQDHDVNGSCAPDCATSAIDCGDHGTCADTSGTAACVCQVGYALPLCRTCSASYQDNDRDGTCEPDCALAAPACGAHGTCSDADGTAGCACDTGYAGVTCTGCAAGFQDNDANGTCEPDCATSGLNCGAHGTCSDSTGLVRCACDTGWDGPLCDIPNNPPVARVVPAGPLSLREGVVQALDGSSSSDSDGTIVWWTWTLPAGHTAATLGIDPATLDDPSISFTTPAVTGDTTLVFVLVVIDNDGGTASVSVSVTVVDNLPPVAVVLPASPRSVRFGATLALDSSGSTDDVAIASRLWGLPGGYTAAQLGLVASMLDDTAITFTAPVVPTDTLLVFALTLVDDQGASTVVDVEVTVLANRPPVAVVDPAGPLQVGRGRRIQLNGAGSTDPDGTVTAHAWTLPAGFTAAQLGLLVTDLDNAGITPTMPATLGTLVFTLTVTDNDGATGAVSVTINVVNGAPVLMCNGDAALAQTYRLVRNGPPAWARAFLDFSSSTDPEGDAITLTFTGPSSGSTSCAADFGFFASGLTAQFSFPSAPPPTPACQGNGPFTLTVVGDDGLAQSAPMVLTFFVENSAPAVNVMGPSSLAAGAFGTLTATATDPDPGDTLSYAWRVRAASDPALDCGPDWIVGATNGATLDITAPVAPAVAECAAEAVFYVDVTDNHGATGTGGWVVPVSGAGPTPHAVTVWGNPIAQGATGWLSAMLAPGGGAADTVTWSWTVTVVSGGCVPGDLVLTVSGTDNKSSSQRQARPGVGKSGCVFSVLARATVNGTPVDGSITVPVTNSAPTVTVAPGLMVGPAQYEAIFPPGVIPTLVATTGDADGWDPDLGFTWGGAGLPLVTCTPACTGTRPDAARSTTSITYNAAPPAGSTQTFTLQVTDGDDTTTASITVRIEPCLYVGTTVTNPGAALGTRTHPYLVVQDAVDDAVARADTNVCVFQGAYTQDVVIRATPTNTPMVSGGYAPSTGLPLTTGRSGATTLRSIDADGVTFSAGATNQVEYITFTQDPALFAAGASAAVTIEDASPLLDHVMVTGGAGDPAMGVEVRATAADAQPRIQASTITGSDRTLAGDVMAVRVRRVAGLAEPVLRDVQVVLGPGLGLGVGVAVEPGANPTLSSVTISDGMLATGFVTVAGVYAYGTAGDPATFLMEDSSVNLWMASAAVDAFGIRLHRTDGVRVLRSTIRGNVGTRTGFGIADGYVHVNGTVEPGASVGLELTDNTDIEGLGPWAFNSGCVGTRFANGVLLVGTGSALLQGNRSPSPEWFGGIRGGRALYAHDWATQRVPPSVAGLWLVGAGDVEVTDSDVVNGTLAGNNLCPKPVPFPVTQALLDGVPGSLGQPPGQASTRLVVDRSAVYCTVSPENGGGMTSFTWCVAADLQGSGGAAVANSVVASLSANVNVAVRLAGGTAADVVNNLLDPDFLRMGMPPPANTVYKYAILADRIGAGALRAYNNIIVVRRDDPYDLPTERLALREVTTAGTDSNLGAFSNNLLYIEGDDLSSATAPAYVRVLEYAGPASKEYAADGVNDVAGVVINAANLVALPGLLEPGPETNKKAIRLNPASAAVGQGLASVAPAFDVDGQARTAPVDMGHDEVSP